MHGTLSPTLLIPSFLGTEWLLVCDAPGGLKSESAGGRYRLALWTLTAHEASMSRRLQAGLQTVLY